LVRGLRDYGTAKWEGGSTECDYRKNPLPFSEKALTGSTIGNASSTGHAQEGYKEICGKCGAKRIDSQLGLEKTPEEYVAKMVEVFREVRRVLKKEGTCWLNLGDSYAGNNSRASNNGRAGFGNEREGIFQKTGENLKSKDLCGIPWRVAFALQADGWYLRQDIIWAKPNPMPESVTDRCTKSHEYIFLLTKSPKYYFDNESIKEKAVKTNDMRPRMGQGSNTIYNQKRGERKEFSKEMGGSGTSFKGHSGYHKANGELIGDDGKRNKRSVWTVTTKPFSEAHFATFPEDLIVPMVKAGCPENGIVLDPFFGAGTTGLVAQKLKRNWIGIELNQEYIKIANDRLSQKVLI